VIALDTNALVRVVVEDDIEQAHKVRKLIESAEQNGESILILTEVLIETVWVLESVYHCTRTEVYNFLKTLVRADVFTFADPEVIVAAIQKYRKKGDFADIIIVIQAIKHGAKKLFSFDRKLQKNFPDYVINS